MKQHLHKKVRLARLADATSALVHVCRANVVVSFRLDTA
jgi:hypothetical protein